MSAHRRITRAALLSVLVVGACNIGQRPENFPAARVPAGVQVALRVRGEQTDRVGELYVVDSDGLMVRGQRLLRVRWEDVAAMDVLNLGSQYDVAFGETVRAEKRERLALVSRFPNGLSGPILVRVLSLIPQSAVDSLR